MGDTPSRDEFLELAEHYSLVPVWRKLFADRETPVSAFEKLVGDEPGFLLESVEGGENWARWSFLGWDPLFSVVSHDGRIESEVSMPNGTPIDALADLADRFRVPDLAGLPPLHSGLVGFLGYDCVRYLEHLPHPPPDDRQLPEMAWQAVGSLAAFDRAEQSLTLVRNVLVGSDPGAQYDQAVAALDLAAARLGESNRYTAQQFALDSAHRGSVTSTMSETEFKSAVAAAKKLIVEGEVFQVVLSQRLGIDFEGDPFGIYRALRLINPSPFLFFYRMEGLTIAGSSPELMTRVRDRIAYSRPIAGTRPRGHSAEADASLEDELRNDPKERAEHVMLIDLARNDLGRVCEFGSVAVDDLMTVERYSHVMHLVSAVSGKLRPEVSAVDVLRGDISPRNGERSTESCRHGDHRPNRACSSRPVRGRPGIHRLQRQPRYRDLSPHSRCGRGACLGAGRRRHRGRLRSATRVRRDNGQGGGRALRSSYRGKGMN